MHVFILFLLPLHCFLYVYLGKKVFKSVKLDHQRLAEKEKNKYETHELYFVLKKIGITFSICQVVEVSREL